MDVQVAPPSFDRKIDPPTPAKHTLALGQERSGGPADGADSETRCQCAPPSVVCHTSADASKEAMTTQSRLVGQDIVSELPGDSTNWYGEVDGNAAVVQ